MIKTWIEIGFNHIWDMDGYDHLLYLITLCALFSLRDWKKVIWIATAFTIGHSISLVLNAFSIISISPSLVETLIPVTIILTALYNLFTEYNESRNYAFEYFIAALFGLVHGLGVSNFLKNMLLPNDSLVGSLLGFNIGVELGQILIILITLGLSYILLEKMNLQRRYWINGISIFSILLCLKILFL